MTYYFRVKIKLFVTSLTRFRIRIGLASWIRIRTEAKDWIRIENNADPQHCLSGLADGRNEART